MMIEDIFSQLPFLYSKGGLTHRTAFYFAIAEVRKTVILNGETCTVIDGKTGDNVDCVCKTSEEFFQKVWNEGHRPGLRDFMNGSIKSNAPQLLQAFMTSFGK